MLVSTRGIVLHSLKYSETSLVVKIYTEKLGMQSYMVKGSRSKRSSQKPAYFQPLSLVDLVVYHKENKQLHSIKEIKPAYAWRNIPFSIEKQAVLLFLGEMLYKTLKEEGPGGELFSFIFNSLHWYDLEKNDYLNFHLFFLLKLTKFLGFYPKTLPAGGRTPRYFDLQEGIFLETAPVHPNYVSGTVLRDLIFFLKENIDKVKKYNQSTARRREMLNMLVAYFQLHLPGMGSIKSLDVLTTVLH